MIALYYDHELAVHQIILFVDMRIGDSKGGEKGNQMRKKKY